MSVEKRGGRYLVRWRDSAGQQRSKTVGLWRDAVALDGEMKRKKAMGELISHERGRIRLCDFYEIWRANYGGVHLTPRTASTYHRLYSRHILPSIGSHELRKISREHIDGMMTKLTASLMPSSVRKCLAILQGVLQRAVEWGYIATNPATGVKKPRLVQRRGLALSATAVTSLVTELDLRSATIVRFLAGSGLRPGELRALTWADVMPDAILVTKAVSSNEVGPTKTNSLRSVEPTADARAALREWSLGRGRLHEGLVFPGTNGRVWTDNGWRLWQRKRFAPAAARAGLAGVVPYDLRHTFASQRIAEGMNVLELARQLGHSPTMTLTVYGHQLNRGGLDVHASIPRDRIAEGA